MLTRGETKTGGRQATLRPIPPKLALAVAMPSVPAPDGWRWVPLTSVARMESGHTPSRRHPEYWGGSLPWISLADAKLHHGGWIASTIETTNELGIANSSARMLPAKTVCLSRTASVGYVTVTRRPMATSQDFVNWICSDAIDPEFLKYLFLSEGDDLLRFASGAVHSTIYFPEAKAFHVCMPDGKVQRRIVSVLDEAFAGIETTRANTEKNAQNARAVFESHLQSVLTQGGDGWIEKPFSELCDIKHGYAFDGEFFRNSGEYILLTPGNFYERGGYRDRGEKQKYYIGEIPRGYVLAEGDLLVAMTEQAAGLLGSPILVPENGKFLHNQRLGLVTKRPGIPWLNEFFFHVFNTQSVRKAIHGSASGVKVRHTSPTKIGDVRVALPTSIDEQKRIVWTLATLSEESERLKRVYEQKLAALDALKQSLLREAFSGRL